jgi:hypothetical protein
VVLVAWAGEVVFQAGALVVVEAVAGKICIKKLS